MTLINVGIKAFGGFDKIFFDILWPLVTEVIPISIGEAFKTVPLTTGTANHRLRVKAKCAELKGETCPGQKLELDIYDRVGVAMTPEPFVRNLVEEEQFVLSF